MKRTIHILTSNTGKFREIGARLEEAGFAAEQLDIPHPEIQSDSLDEVVQFKCAFIRRREQGLTFVVDDSGLFIDSLGGFPGVYSSYVFHTLGCDGILDLLAGKKGRDARFECCLCFSAPWLKEQLTFKGTCSGKISQKSAGTNGFGFDPIFIPSAHKMTFAQMGTHDKNRISHRGIAVEKLVKYLAKGKIKDD
jgi:XTP/dITP diphosphohydrolase